ncbi:MAG: hypothetical protein HXX18_09760 [Bacteroidetes bacterium]|nr:hypothetical protein [Bacteroidota bacterium]
MIKNWEKFYSEIQKLSLADLEIKIKAYYEEFKRSSSYEDERLSICLSQRKYLINENFHFTPNAVRHIERVNRLLLESTAKVIERTNLLYKQMAELKSNNDDFLTEFSVDGTVSVDYIDEASVLIFKEDENNGQSDYVAMADVLDFTQIAFEYLVSFRLWSESYAIDKQITDDSLEYNWNQDILNVYKLGSINFFCKASHILFTDTNYSISDIIRIRNISNEVIVTHKNLTHE